LLCCTRRYLGRRNEESSPLKLKLERHDASRIEWSVYLPMPRGLRATEGEVELCLEVPENAYSPHSGWDQLQLLARLSSPRSEAGDQGARSLDEVRRDSLAAARRMKAVARADGEVRRLAASRAGLARFFEPLIEAALAELQRARDTLSVETPFDAADLRKERQLADEYWAANCSSCSPSPTGLLERAGALAHAAVAGRPRRAAEAAKAARRAARGRVPPPRRARPPLAAADDPEAVAMFIDRAAQLKKHFHEVLYLEAESTMIDQKWRDAVGIGGAAAAFVGYFVLNMLQSNAAARAGLGLGTVLTLGAIAYALKTG